MQINRKQKEFVANLFFAIALYFGFYENIIWIQYLTSAFVWIMLLGYLFSLLVLLKDRSARVELRKGGDGFPKWVTLPFDFLVMFVLISSGWYGTAGAYLFSCLYAFWAYALPGAPSSKESR